MPRTELYVTDTSVAGDHLSQSHGLLGFAGECFDHAVGIPFGADDDEPIPMWNARNISPVQCCPLLKETEQRRIPTPSLSPRTLRATFWAHFSDAASGDVREAFDEMPFDERPNRGQHERRGASSVSDRRAELGDNVSGCNPLTSNTTRRQANNRW